MENMAEGEGKNSWDLGLGRQVAGGTTGKMGREGGSVGRKMDPNSIQVWGARDTLRRRCQVDSGQSAAKKRGLKEKR